VPDIQANEGLLYTALINLIENGTKFSPNNTVHIKIKSVNQVLSISFNNEGLPIPEKELPHIFEPFKRGSNARKTKGHGVGLSLTKRIILLHNGHIIVDSSEKEGTTFTISLPI
jgi:signal transduction histidine kinase